MIDPANRNSVHDQAARGHRSTLVSQTARLICKVASVLVVARLVAPTDYGLFAMAASFTLLLWMFRDMGLGVAAIQTPNLSAGLCASLFRAQLGLGLLLTLITAASGPLVARFYGQPELVPLLLTVSPSFLFIGLAGLPRVLMNRALRFDEINRIETISAVTSTTSMIGAAASGAGVYSFAIFLVSSDLVWAALAWKCEPWHRQADAPRESLSALARTGRKLTYFQALNYLSQQAEIVGVGQYLGTYALGLYTRAGQMLTLPTVHLAEPLSQVTLTALSRLNTVPEEFKKQAASSVTMIAYMTLPVAALCIAIPEEIILIVLGSQWHEAAPLLRWLAVSAALAHASHIAQSIAIAVDQSRRLVFTAAITLLALIAAVVIGLPHGPLGVAISVALTNLIIFLPRLWWRLQGSAVGVACFLTALIGPFITSLLLGSGAAIGRACCHANSLPLRLLFAIIGAALVLGTSALNSSRLRNEWHAVLSYLPVVGRAKKLPTSPTSQSDVP